MIGSSAHQSVDSRVVQDFAKITDQLSAPTHLGHPSHSRLTALTVRLADVLDDHSGDLHHLLGQIPAAAIAHDSDENRLGILDKCLLGVHRARDPSMSRRCDCRGALDKRSTDKRSTSHRASPIGGSKVIQSGRSE